MKYVCRAAWTYYVMVRAEDTSPQDSVAVENDGFSLLSFGPGSSEFTFKGEDAILDVHLGTTEGRVTFDSERPTPSSVQAHTFSFIPNGLVSGMTTIRSGPSVLLQFRPAALFIIPARGAISEIEEPIWNMVDPAMIGAAVIVQDYLQTPNHTIRSQETRFLRDLLSIRLLQITTSQKKTSLVPNASRPIQRALEFIEAHLGENIPLERVAEVAGMSPFHFARTFRAAFGVSVGRYVILRRIERAQYLISTSDLSLAEIAYALGFSSQSHMTASFRRFVGRTPNSFREVARMEAQSG